MIVMMTLYGPAPVHFRWASLQEQLFLRAVIAEFRRLGLEEATFQQVESDSCIHCLILLNPVQAQGEGVEPVLESV